MNMKRIGFNLLITGFWLLVSGFYTNTHAQEDTLTILTYYPAPYGVYQTLELMQDSASTTLTISAYHNTESTSPTLTFRKADNTMASPGKVDIDAILGTINFQGYDLNGFNTGARIYAKADANWSADERGTRLYFQTRDGSGDLTDTMIISADGKIGIGANPPYMKLHIFENINSTVGITIGNNNQGIGASTGVFFSQADPVSGANVWAGMWGINSTEEFRLWQKFLKPMTFYTNDLKRMEIDGNGNVIIGTTMQISQVNGNVSIGSSTTPPSSIKLQVAGGHILLDNNKNLMAKDTGGTNQNLIGLGADNNTYLNIITGTGRKLIIYDKGTSSAKMVVTDDGSVGIGTSTPSSSYKLQVVGYAAKDTGTSWTDLCDRRLKKNIRPIENALDKILKLKGVTYQWKEPEKHSNMAGTYMGLIAQDVEGVFPEWVGVDGEGYKNLTIKGFEALVPEAVRELKTENDKLIEKIAELENRIKSIETKLSNIQ